MAWFKKTRKRMESATADKPSRVPEGLWVKCPGCAQVLYNKDLENNLNVCPKCAHHFRITASERLHVLFDQGRWSEHHTRSRARTTRFASRTPRRTATVCGR